MSHEITRSEFGLEVEEQPDLWERFEQEGYDYTRPRRGDFLTGIILELRPEAVIVDIGAKRDGFVPAHDLRKLDEEEVADLEIGDEVPVFVERPSNASGDLILSLARGRELDDWDRAQELSEDDEVIELQVDGYNKGGVTVSFGQLRGFVPASHLQGFPRRLSGQERLEALSQYGGQVLRVKVIEVDQDRRRFVLSERKGEHAYRKQRKQELLKSLSVGDNVTGKVTALKPFGAFVDIGGADGLVHVSEIEHKRVGHPADVLREGQEVTAQVIRLDSERGRIGLSMKRLVPTPWDDIDERYYPGQVVPGRITAITDFGTFASLEPGLEGLIHISKLSFYHVQHPKEVVSVGDEVMVRIMRIDTERQRISLSLRDVPQWVDASTSEAIETAVTSEDTSQVIEEDTKPVDAEPMEGSSVDERSVA